MNTREIEQIYFGELGTRFLADAMVGIVGFEKTHKILEEQKRICDEMNDSHDLCDVCKKEYVYCECSCTCKICKKNRRKIETPDKTCDECESPATIQVIWGWEGENIKYFCDNHFKNEDNEKE